MSGRRSKESEDQVPDIVEVNVTVPDGDERQAALAELEDALASVPAAGYAEVWVDHDSFPALCLLVNGEHGWLMCLRYSGDAGFSSRNPAYVGDPDATLEYYLSNGQRDVYPVAWAYPRERAVEAVRIFAQSRRVPD